MLLYITKVQYAPSHHLATSAFSARRAYLDTVPWRDLPTVKLSSVKDTLSLEDHGVKHTVELKATLCGDESPLSPSTDYAFLLHSVSGAKYLLRSSGDTQPTVLTELNAPTSAAEVSGMTLTVTLISGNPLYLVYNL